MPPKQKKEKGPSASILKLKAHLDANKKLEEEFIKQQEEEERRIAEEIRLAKEQEKIDLEEQARKKELEKLNKKKDKKELQRFSQLQKLKQMQASGMIIPNISQLDNIIVKPIVKKEETIIPNNNTIINKIDKTNFIQLKSPICCVLGHVDAGKTSFLDKLRNSNIQSGEAGGITQQIGATFFPNEMLSSYTNSNNIKIAGLLMIDTPGHEQFANLRHRGSNISDIVILVIDIFSGLQNQTIEAINLVKKAKCPFIVAVNKIDRLYGWNGDLDISKQNDDVKAEFEMRINKIKLQLSEQCLNSELYYKNDDFKKNVSLVPISAKSGFGIPELILLLINLVQQYLEEKMIPKDTFRCQVMEVKQTVNFGSTIDVILCDGVLNIGDTIVLSGLNGPFETKIKHLLTPEYLEETKTSKNSGFINHKFISASQSIKICADNLEMAIPGTSLYLCNSEEDVKKYKLCILEESATFISKISRDKIGVSIQGTSVGPIEALINILESQNIPIGNIILGQIHKKDIIFVSQMKEKNDKYAVILAFDFQITHDAENLAKKENIKIFNSNIIYKLEELLKNHIRNIDLAIKEKNKHIAVFPVKLKILSCFRAKDPLILGCKVEKGQVRVGTPLITNNGEENIALGKILGIQINNKDILIGKQDMELAIKLEGITDFKYFDETGEQKIKKQNITYGRHINEGDILCSKISRKSIDALKTSFKSDMSDDDWKLIIEFKTEQNID